MATTVAELVGLALVFAAFVCLAVVAWSVTWQAGLSVAAVEGLLVGAVMVLAANRHPSKPSATP